MIRLVVAEDSHLIREGLRMLLWMLLVTLVLLTLVGTVNRPGRFARR